jgi:hypothetical protein
MISRKYLMLIGLLCLLCILQVTSEDVKETRAKAGTNENDTKHEIEEAAETLDRHRRWFGWGGYGWGYPYYGFGYPFYGKRDADTMNDDKAEVDHMNEKDHSSHSTSDKHDISKRAIDMPIEKKETDETNMRKRRWYGYGLGYGLGYGWGGYGLGYGYGLGGYGYWGKRNTDNAERVLIHTKNKRAIGDGYDEDSDISMEAGRQRRWRGGWGGYGGGYGGGYRGGYGGGWGGYGGGWRG